MTSSARPLGPIPAREWRRVSRGRALPQRAPVPYQEGRAKIRPGDVLLFRGRGPVAKIIGAFGRSSYSHAAIACELTFGGDAPRVLVAEFRELRGSRLVLLSKAVEGADVDVFRVIVPGLSHLVEDDRAFEEYRIRGAVNDAAVEMVLEGLPYSYATIARLALARLPLFLLRRIPWVRRFLPARTWSEDDAAAAKSFVCSVFVAHVWRTVGNVDLVPRLSDDSTEPADLARSALLEFQGTLEPEALKGTTPGV